VNIGRRTGEIAPRPTAPTLSERVAQHDQHSSLYHSYFAAAAFPMDAFRSASGSELLVSLRSCFSWSTLKTFGVTNAGAAGRDACPFRVLHYLPAIIASISS